MRQNYDPFDQEDLELDELEKQYVDTEDQLGKLEERVQHYQTQATKAKEQNNPELLANTLIRLARVNSRLGSKAAYAKYIARNAERAYKRTTEQLKLKYINEKNAIGKAESMAKVDEKTEYVFKIFSQVQLLADKADDMGYRTDTFLKMAQSGLSLIKNDLNGRP